MHLHLSEIQMQFILPYTQISSVQIEFVFSLSSTIFNAIRFNAFIDIISLDLWKWSLLFISLLIDLRLIIKNTATLSVFLDYYV
jgi:hypothetical protein